MPTTASPPLYIFDEHNEAFFFWHKARRDGFLRSPLDLLHIDAHSDMGKPSPLAQSLYPPAASNDDLEYYRRLAETELYIGDFILPAILNDLVRNVYFVFPSWRNHTFRRRKMNVGSFLGEGRIVKCTLRAADASNPHVRKALPDLKSFRYVKLPLGKVPVNRRVILDIDLDFFACRDSIWNEISYTLEIAPDQLRARDVFLRDRTLPYGGIEFDFYEEDGRAFVRVSPKKREEVSHLPSEQEIVHSVETLIEALAAKRIRPAVVTVCRSCNSGFTPAEYAGFIENELKRALLGVAEWHLAEAA